ncbi:MAG: hypothetical protein AB7U20_14090 [Planctomycetaceae bacterium]
MTAQPDSLRTVDDLRAYVHDALCERENLLADQFQTDTYELRQNGVPCGLQFHLHGPRSVALSAIWSMQQNVVYFYDARGERYRKVQLPHRLSVEPSAA